MGVTITMSVSTDSEKFQFGKSKNFKKKANNSSSSGKRIAHRYTIENDEYSLDKLFEAGSVVHNREWGYNLVDQAAAVEVAINFKARCTFSCAGEGTCRTLRIIDDTGTVHHSLIN